MSPAADRPVTMPPLAITMGEPAGIGGELTLAAWLARRATATPFFAIDDPGRLADLARRLGLDVPVRAIAAPQDAAGIFAEALPVLPQALPHPVVPGRLDAAQAPAVIASIRRAVELARGGEAAAIVTNPIHKKILLGSGFGFPGHTEYLLDLAGGAGSGWHSIMMLACPELRVVPVTIHQPLREAIARLATADIVTCGRVTAAALRRDFGIARPRLAVAGLNPHAGEGGALGDEEERLIAPAIGALRAEGIEVSGPWSADTMFHAQARQHYDAALCMYHDQALIPIKTIDFFGGVNVTLGLPFVRTSPDHGTALDIAGRGQADARSFLAALDLAARLAARRARPAADGTAHAVA